MISETLPELVKALLLEKTPETASAARADRVYPVLMALRLLATWPQELVKSDIAYLDMLCRKIDVTKNVFEWYEADWKKPAVPVPLTSSSWIRIIAVLLAYPPSYKEVERGRALKQLNAAFTALSLASQGASANADTRLPALLHIAEERLRTLTATVTS